MNWKRKLGIFVCLVGMLGVLPAHAQTAFKAAGAQQPEPLVTAVLDSAALRFEPRIDAAAWVLTVSGPARFFLRREFAGQVPRIEFLGDEGGRLADGPYSWELRTSASKETGVSSDVAQWGRFIVREGVVLLPEATVERPATSVQISTQESQALFVTLHDDDVYIDGQLCVGNGGGGCTGAQSLALKTILMRDDNVRIRFEDTSDPGGTFASTDWQLAANDSTGGGDDYFAIQDLGDTGLTTASPLRIDAGAGDNAIYVDGSGEVGLGTATPGARLHVMGDAIVEGDFAAGSSRDIKHAFAPVEPSTILAKLVELPVNEWSYRAGQLGIRHLGPVAEEFHAAFALGRDERHVSPVDLSGVAFVAIQGLHEVVRARDAEIDELTRSRDELAARIEALERAEERTSSQRRRAFGW